MYFLFALRRAGAWLNSDSSDAESGQYTRLLYADIFFSGLFACAATFHATFAIRLGADKEAISLLTSLPYLLMAIASIPMTRFMQARRHYKRWLMGFLMAFRLGYVVIALFPVLFSTDLALASSVVVIWIIFLSLPQTLFDNEWRARMGELIPERRRAFIFSRRSIILGTTVAIATTSVGALLNRSQDRFPGNYQTMYVLIFLVSLGSFYVLKRLPIASSKPATAPDAAKSTGARPRIQMSQAMRRMLINSGVYYFGIQFYSGLYSIHYVRTLKATDDWVGFATAAGYIGSIIGFFAWERLLRKHSDGWALRRASLFTWIFPVVLAVIPNVPLIAFSNLLVNLMHPGVELASSNYLLRLPKPEDRAAYISMYTTVISVASLIAPLMGVWLANSWPLGIPGAIFLSGVGRVIGGILFNVNRIAEPEQVPAQA